jgi:predicted amidophosphoribosyltransferase
MLRQFKYNYREELLPVLGDWLVESIRTGPWLTSVEAVTCVPTHWRRQIRSRAYPAGELARYVARRVDLPFVSILRRVRAGPHQVGLSHNERLQNVIGAFGMRRGVELCDARLLILDDVRTTGATLNECAKVLHRAGAAETYAAVVVRARAAHSQASVGGF